MQPFFGFVTVFHYIKAVTIRFQSNPVICLHLDLLNKAVSKTFVLNIKFLSQLLNIYSYFSISFPFYNIVCRRTLIFDAGALFLS